MNKQDELRTVMKERRNICLGLYLGLDQGVEVVSESNEELRLRRRRADRCVCLFACGAIRGL